MPNLRNAEKSLRQYKKRAAKNLAAKIEVKRLLKDARKAIDAKNIIKAEELAKTLIQKLDKIAKTGYFKKNKSSRLKSRLMKKLNLSKKS